MQSARSKPNKFLRKRERQVKLMIKDIQGDGGLLYQLEVAECAGRSGATVSSDDVGRGQGKIADILPPIQIKTLLLRAKNGRNAKRWAEKFGTVLRCFKVDKTLIYERIENIKLEPQTLAYDYKEDTFTLNENLEVSPARRREINIPVELIDK